ncbi:hypothetical protein D9757_010474 [Collybiopsis confluens]|uniref:Uncharacterized protein n=1 Tax=Collybiopsis confluens TaxID=2823264 RepID=A0A8H5FWU3_9AGAR|nr:hypothetical protein D9757_013765 [Collybiopsis confluens]KAF5369597.1 hypothetical protein D9757_010474 [Collybiopsis confluens]
MALFVPILRIFMLFLNVWDTYKTLKPPPTRTRNGKVEPPTIRSVTQRKRDLKGCLAVWIVWCCFSVYERILEPIISLFIPFYNEFKSLFILFLIFTRARGAEPIFLHLMRPLLRPYTKSIDNSLELFRLIGDLLFAIISFPLRPLAALLPSFFASTRHEDEIPPPYSEAEAERRTPSPYSHQGSNGHVQSFYPSDPTADMEWRQYPNLPSAYPPTPLVTLSQLPRPRPIPGHVGYDPGTAAGPYTVWVPPVPEEDDDDDDDDEENTHDTQQGFHRSLLPPRVPLHPGLGHHDGLSDESDNGAENQKILLGEITRDDSSGRSSGTEETDDMEVDADAGDEDDGRRDRRYNSDEEDDDDDSDEDSFNITLQTPRVPLSLRPSSATASRSTIRLRASARSVFEKEAEGRKTLSGSGNTSTHPLPPLEAASNSGNSQDSSPSSIESESVSISSGDDASMTLSNQDLRLASVLGPSVVPLSGLDNDDIVSDSSLGSAPGVDTSPTSHDRGGRKRSHSRSFPLDKSSLKEKERLAVGVVRPSLQQISSAESTSSSAQSASDTSDAEQGDPAADPALQRSTMVKQKRSLRSAAARVDESDVGQQDEGEVRAEVVSGTRKRRKVISLSSASGGQGGLSTASESDSVGLGSRTSSRRGRLVSVATAGQGKPATAAAAPPPPTTRTVARTRRQLPTSLSTSDAEKPAPTRYPSASTSTLIAKGKGKASATKSTTSTVPTRKRFEVTSKSMMGPSTRVDSGTLLSQSSTSTLRTTRFSAAAVAVPAAAPLASRIELSDGLDNDEYPLHVAKRRPKKPA